MAFNHLNVPDQWNQYFTKYPQGYTILEALLNWVQQVDDMTDSLNAANLRLDEFIAQFDVDLQETVQNILNEWLADGTFDQILGNLLLGIYTLGGTGIDPTGATISTGIQAFFDNVAAQGGGTIRIPKGSYRTNTQLTYYPDKITIIGSHGAVFQFEQLTGYALKIQAYEKLYVKDHLAQASTHYVEGLTFKVTNDSVFHIQSKGTGEGAVDDRSKFASRWTFRNCSFYGGNLVEINTDTWATKFEDCYVNTKGYGIYMPSGGTNYGESINADNVLFDSCQTALYNNNGAGDIRATNCKIDYCHVAANAQHGIISIDEAFVETSFDDDNHFICEGYGSTLHIGFMEITDTLGTQRTKEFFRVSDDTTDQVGAGLIFDTIKLNAGYSTPSFLVKGTGSVKGTNMLEYKDSKKPVVSRYMNKLAFGNCDTSNTITEWDTVAGSIAPTIDNTVFNTGTGSLKFSRAASGTTGSVSQRKTFKMKPGQIIRLFFRAKTNGITGSGLTMAIDRAFLNDKGTTISSGNLQTITTDYVDWTEVVIVPSIQAPAGTDTIQLTFWAGNWTTTMNAWIDDIVVNII